MLRFQFRETLALSLVVLAGLIALLVYSGPASNPNGVPAETLVLYCAAGLQPPVSEIVSDYESANSVTFQTQFAGSGTLLSEIRIAGGDLFVAADKQYLLTARQMNLVAEILPIATQTPVIVVLKGNPKKIGRLTDLLKSDVRLSLADPKMAAIGKVVQGLLGGGVRGQGSGVSEKETHTEPRSQSGGETRAIPTPDAARLSSPKSGRQTPDASWDRLWQKAVIHRETVNQVANDVKLSAADAGIVWDATAVQYADLQIIRVGQFERSKNEIAVGVLSTSKNPQGTRRFVDFLTAPDKGLAVFRKYGYTVTEERRPSGKR